MKEIVIVSGKGGTGKTVIAASFASLAKNKVMGDCDVDASNLYLLLHPEIKERHDFFAGVIPVVDLDKCNKCGICESLCRYDAIKVVERGASVDYISCEGCGLCGLACPEEAILMRENQCGEWYISETKYGPLVHARLGIAEENSGILVTTVSKNAREIAEKSGLDLIVIDGPPGIGCPLIASISGANMAIIVTEPTLSGIHDLKRVTEVSRHFNVEPVIIINKFDINLENTSHIEDYCSENNISVIGKIHFDNVITQALVQGLPVVEFSENRVKKEIENIWNKIFKKLNSSFSEK